MSFGILSEMTRSDLEGFAPEVAVWPVGATEPHGWHLPFGTDTLSVEAISRSAVTAANEQGARILMLPPLAVGIDTNMMAFPCTLTLKPSTMMAVARDLIDSMVHHGVPKFLMVNGHGGNKATLKAIYREYADRDIFICAIDYWTVAPELVEEVIETEVEHADEFETSLGLYWFEDLVRMEKAQANPTRECRLKKFREYGGEFTRPWHKYTLNSGTGHPEKATRAKGQKLAQTLTDRLAEVLLELSAAERDESFPY